MSRKTGLFYSGNILLGWAGEVDCMRELTINEISVGMVVAASWLRKIYDTYITLVDIERRDNDIFGRIAYIGDQITQEAGDVILDNDRIYAIYNSREEDEGEVTYDE